jgi:NTP pyrophosphatase (non-canonical NTP hydrolase)
METAVTKDRKNLDQLTKQDYQKALGEIQETLAECVGDLIILGGYLDSDLSLDPENTHYVLMAAKDIVRVACQSVKTALSYTYSMV